ATFIRSRFFPRCRAQAWGGARTAYLPHRLFVSRPHRNHSTHRDRKKERNHDDRFRARSRTRAREVARGIDLSGVPAAFSPDHDDDSRGTARCFATCPRKWNGQRAAATARNFHRRRTLALAISHPLHAPRPLSLSGSPRALVRRTPPSRTS